MSNKFIDPENIKDIEEKIKNCPTIKDINDLVNITFPTWIVGFIDKYSDDYSHLNTNWELLSKKNININPTQIIIVDNILYDDNHKLIQIFIDLYTMVGFLVRTKNDVFICKICNKAIPNLEMYKRMKEMNINVPEKWSNKCSKC